MGFQMQTCSMLRFSWSILVKCCVHLRMSSRKTQISNTSSKEDYVPQVDLGDV